MQSILFHTLFRIIVSSIAGVALCTTGIPFGLAGESVLSLATPVELPFEKVLPGFITDYEMLTSSSDTKHMNGKEYLLRTTRLSSKGFHFTQMCGRSGGEVMKPWLMVRNVKTGKGIAISLAYCGNWSVAIVPRVLEAVVLRVDTWPASLPVFDTINGLPLPGALVAEFVGHWDNGAQPITRFIRRKLLRDLGQDWPPVQYNDWFANSGEFSEKSLLEAAKAAADVGCELFTVDAGWYGGNDPSLKWHEAVGDWTVNKEKLPGGLEPVVTEVRRLGMKFGLWVEIDRAGPNTPIGKARPDWFLHKPPLLKRPTLDYGNPLVLAWVKSQIDRLMAAYKLDYLKMDYNANPYSARLVVREDRLYRHYHGLTEFWKYIRDRYPQLVTENCSSGSLRQDVMAAALTDTHWVSDRIDPDACLAMNYGATYLFPPEMCSHWTVIWSRKDAQKGILKPGEAPKSKALDLESQFTTNMMGHLGLSGRIQEWNEKTRKIAAERIALYKKIRPILRNADVYHLTAQSNPKSPSTVQAALYVDPQTRRAVLFAFQGGASRLETTLRLRGLCSEQKYRVLLPEALGGKQSFAGSDLIEKGLLLKFPHRGASVVICIEPEGEE